MAGGIDYVRYLCMQKVNSCHSLLKISVRNDSVGVLFTLRYVFA